MQSLFNGDKDTDAKIDPALAKEFQKLSEMAGMMFKDDKQGVTNADPEITASINEVLENLNLNQEAAHGDFSAESFASLFQNFNASSEGVDANAFLPFMQSMVQSLLSPEILLPSLSEISDLYPAWLEENGSKLPASDKERYEKQLVLMKEVISELKKEKPTDTTDIRQVRFNIVLEKMQKMQDLGQPPDDLLAQCQKSGQSGLPGLDSSSLPIDCNLM